MYVWGALANESGGMIQIDEPSVIPGITAYTIEVGGPMLAAIEQHTNILKTINCNDVKMDDPDT